MQELYDFLVSLLPAALVAKALGLAGVSVAVVQLVKRAPWVSAHKKVAAPIVTLLVSHLFGWVATGFDLQQWTLATGAGLVIFLTAVGGFETVKNTRQAGSGKNKAA